MVEHNLAKVGVAGSSPVFRSEKYSIVFWMEFFLEALVVELVDTQDLKSCGQQRPCGFKYRLGHKKVGDNFYPDFFYCCNASKIYW